MSIEPITWEPKHVWHPADDTEPVKKPMWSAPGMADAYHANRGRKHAPPMSDDRNSSDMGKGRTAQARTARAAIPPRAT